MQKIHSDRAGRSDQKQGGKCIPKKSEDPIGIEKMHFKNAGKRNRKIGIKMMETKMTRIRTKIFF